MSALTFDDLLDGAKYHAGVALTAYSNQDERAILANAAISMEHLSKALLCSMHPTLLAETRNGPFESLRQLAGFPKPGDRPLRTIGAKGALDRVRELIEIETPKGRLEELMRRPGRCPACGAAGPDQDPRAAHDLPAVCRGTVRRTRRAPGVGERPLG